MEQPVPSAVSFCFNKLVFQSIISERIKTRAYKQVYLSYEITNTCTTSLNVVLNLFNL